MVVVVVAVVVMVGAQFENHFEETGVGISAYCSCSSRHNILADNHTQDLPQWGSRYLEAHRDSSHTGSR